MTRIEEIWTRLEAHFRGVDGALDDLNGPVSDENARALRTRLGSGQAVQELVESMKIHDGQLGDLFLFGPWRLTPSDQILASLKRGFLSALFGKRRPVDTVIIADNGGNSWLELDLASGEIKDVWEDGDSVVFLSYEVFLNRVLSDLDHGALVFDSQTGGYVVAGDPDAYWPPPG